jgi:hypothetical protein
MLKRGGVHGLSRRRRNDLPRLTLAEWPYRMVWLACDLCPRRGQYRNETLVARFGGDVLMPDVRQSIAERPRENAPGAACGVYYTDLRERRDLRGSRFAKRSR